MKIHIYRRAKPFAVKFSNACVQKDESDRHSPEANTQQQMAAQRASGGNIDVPPEVNIYC